VEPLAGDPATLAHAPARPARDRGGPHEALRNYAILDTPPEDLYDRLAATAARLCGAPIALLSFVDDAREWVKAAYGAELGEVDRHRSFGGVAITVSELVVPDASAQEIFAGNPWVASGPRARFYAAVPIATLGGVAIGTLAVLDTRPRDDGARVVESLRSIAPILEGMLERRREVALGGALTCVVDFEGRFIRLSRAWEDLLGYPPEEMVGKPFLEFLHPDDVARSAAEIERWHMGEGTHAFDNRYVTRDGEVRWLSWEAEVVTQEGVLYGLAKDVTEQKKSELALRDSEERYRLLAENATDMIAQHEVDGTFVYVSSASERLLGYAPGELIGRDGYELVHHEDEPSVTDFHHTLLRGADRVRLVFRVRHRDSRWIWVESVGHAIRDQSGRAVGIQTSTRDMTDAKRAMDALQQAEERFRKAFDEGPIGMAIVSLGGSFQRVNRALCEVLGYSAPELLGLAYEDLRHPDSVRAHGVRALLAGETRSLTMEERLVRRDGEPIWISLSVSLMRDADGEPVAYLVQFLDVSERHRAESESRRAREAAERANRAKSQFLARMSHELRTPLNAILGFGQLLQLEELPDEQAESVARMMRGGRHLVEVINDVLDISRIEAGELPIEIRAVRPSVAVEESVMLVAPLASERGMTLRMDLSAADGFVRADHQRLKQVLINLISNAIKYGPEGSEVLVRTSDAAERVRISVSDHGPGVSTEQAERIFEPFERLPEHAAVEGTGLGLALSRNLVRAMGGAIGVRDRPDGPGSEFWVELRAAEQVSEPEPAADGNRAPEPAFPRGEARKLLYIEDSPSNAEFVERMLDLRPSVELVVAGDGESGVDLARRLRPDAILLDMGLPGLDGADVLERLKGDPDTTGIPVVAVSADARPEQERAALAAGAAAFQTKPVDLAAFMRALDQALK
jgi:PAS domain S-box-containing protein